MRRGLAKIALRVWEPAGGRSCRVTGTGAATAQTNWMLKIQFEGFAVRFNRPFARHLLYRIRMESPFYIITLHATIEMMEMYLLRV